MQFLDYFCSLLCFFNCAVTWLKSRTTRRRGVFRFGGGGGGGGGGGVGQFSPPPPPPPPASLSISCSVCHLTTLWQIYKRHTIFATVLVGFVTQQIHSHDGNGALRGLARQRKEKKIMQEISLKKMNGKIMSMKIRVKDFIKPTEIILLFLRLYTLTED